MDAILLAAALQGLLLSFGLLARGRHERGGFFLASLVGLVAISLGIEYAHLVRLVDWQPHLIGLNHSFPFLYSVLLWLYIAALVGFQHRLPVYWHFLPWATHFFFVFLFFYAQSAEYKQLYLRSLEAGRIPLEISITGMAKVAQGLAYTLWSYLLFRKNAEKLGEYYANIDDQALRWLRIFLISLLVNWLIALYEVYGLLTGNVQAFALSGLTNLASSALIFLIGYWVLFRPHIFNRIAASGIMQDPQRADQVGKYQKTRLADVETDRQFEKLEHLMRVDEPYLNAGLTLQELADELGIQAHLLSQVINRKAGVNFFQYVNAYRLRRVQKALQAPESANLSILDIAFEAGFNSKSSFNTLFRNATGKTPQQFRIAAGVSTSSTS